MNLEINLKKNRAIPAQTRNSTQIPRLAVALALAITTTTPLLARPVHPLAKTPTPLTATFRMQSNFYCNPKALSPAERARHKTLTDKLLVSRTAVVETGKGYEFQFSPSQVSLDELAAWVADENKCCPFFDFHIDLENQGRLLCLRLTGAEGLKAFIRSEFQIPAK